MTSSGDDRVLEDLVTDLQKVFDIRLQKRQEIVKAHKQRPDYVSYTLDKNKDERSTDDPITPDTDECMTKRQWEACMFQWRQRLRDAAEATGVSHESR
jgi:hypothetical protein